jgi:hypothetical protein
VCSNFLTALIVVIIIAGPANTTHSCGGKEKTNG